MMVYIEGSSTGVSVSEAEQIEYNSWFADTVHAYGMGVGKSCLRKRLDVPVLDGCLFWFLVFLCTVLDFRACTCVLYMSHSPTLVYTTCSHTASMPARPSSARVKPFGPETGRCLLGVSQTLPLSPLSSPPPGLKNAVELVPILVNKFDFALNEECHEWNECVVYEDTFLAEGKPVFNVEYNLDDSVCDEANALGLDTILKVRNIVRCDRLFHFV